MLSRRKLRIRTYNGRKARESQERHEELRRKKEVERRREEAHSREREAAVHCLSAEGELNFYLQDSHQRMNAH